MVKDKYYCNVYVQILVCSEFLMCEQFWQPQTTTSTPISLAELSHAVFLLTTLQVLIFTVRVSTTEL